MKKDVKSLKLLLRLMDDIKPIKKEQKLKGYSLRFFILLCEIAMNEGETQGFYARSLGWSLQNVNMHIRSLNSDGFIYYSDEPKRLGIRQVRRFYVTKEAKEVLNGVLEVLNV